MSVDYSNEYHELNNYTLGEKVKWLRENKTTGSSKQGYCTSQELAEILNISSSTLNSIEKGNSCNLSTIIEIADYFNVSIDWLCSRSTVSSSDYDVNFICDYTGLDEDSVELLRERKADNLWRGGMLMLVDEKDKSDILHDYIYKFVNEIEIRLDSVFYNVNQLSENIEKHNKLREEIRNRINSIIDNPLVCKTHNIGDYASKKMFLFDVIDWEYEELNEDYSENILENMKWLNSYCYEIQVIMSDAINEWSKMLDMKKSYEKMEIDDRAFFNEFKSYFNFESEGENNE